MYIEENEGYGGNKYFTKYQYEEMQEHIIDIIDQVYGQKEINYATLHYAVDTLSWMLGVHAPEKSPNISRHEMNEYEQYGKKLIQA